MWFPPGICNSYAFKQVSSLVLFTIYKNNLDNIILKNNWLAKLLTY